MMSATESSATLTSPLDARKREASRALSAFAAAAFVKLRHIAPYAAIELVMPGGSVMALLLWLYRRHSRAFNCRSPG
jgi:hypothetical protein